MRFLEQLSSLDALRLAWQSVAAKRGVAGIDRVTIADFGADLEENLRLLSREIETKTYKALPVVRIRPTFLATADRPLVVPTVRDRVVQRAIADLLGPRIEPMLSPSCRAFRKGFSAASTAEDVGRTVASGRPWALRADIKSFFDRIQPELVLDKLRPFVDDESLRFLERLLRCRIFDHHQISEMIVGISQGSPLSPLLSNLYLREVDQTMTAQYPDYLRYCDDMITLEEGEAQVRGALELLGEALAPLGLELNQEKTRICRAEDGFVFLGYHFGPTGRGPAVKAVEALRYRLADLAASATVDVSEIDALYRGWTNYFGHHPECWTVSSVGFLALLRARGLPGAEAVYLNLTGERWTLPAEVTPALGLELARAWIAVGLEEQAWLELASGCGGSRTDPKQIEEWARILAVDGEELTAVTRRLVGSAADRLTVLTEAVTELGHYKLASRLAASTASYVAAPLTSAEARPPADLATEADIPLLLDFFQGRDGVHATEAVNRAGHRSFVPVHRPISAADWTAHLSGERTLALPLVRTGDTAFLGVLDVDVERRALDERLGVPDELLGRALGTARLLRQKLRKQGCDSLLEFSGRKGHHVWVRLQDPVPCFRLRRWLLDVIRSIGALPEGIRIEEFPNRDHVNPDAVGPLVKLPLGVHSQTGKRCLLLDERGEELMDPFEAIRSLKRLPALVVSDAVKSSLPKQAPNSADIGPRAKRMLEGCHVLGYLAKRAEDTSYLNHRQRSTLLYTLGHLGDEGKAALHAIISKTYNYRPDLTDRHLERLPEWPISCPKIRELHPQAGDSDPCTCQFDLRGRGYPTPLLFAMRPAEVPVFRKQASTKAGKPGKAEEREAKPTTRAQGLHKEVEAKIRKIAELKRHRRGVEASIERANSELAALFDQLGADSVQLPIGLLKRVRRADAEGGGWDFLIEV